ncbi:MAG TPA: insulinase family protein [Thermoanaerobaculia bacterium]|nr:insulinase family protein [Thermoanaerobaculia bacterium]
MKSRQSSRLLLSALAALLPLAASGQSAAPAPQPAAAPVPATVVSPSTQALVRNPAARLPTDPNLTIGKLPNGLTYYIKANRRPEGRAELWLAVNAGSVLEDPDQQGLAHFVEHMAFNGTRDFQKQDLLHYLETVGMQFGADVNASTSFDETVYTLRVPTDKPEYLEKGLSILENWASAIAFDPEEVDKERGVVISEWRVGRGAEARMQDKQFPVLFQGSRYAERIPIGKMDILEHAPPAALKRFFEDWYRPDLMAVVAVGDFDRAQVEKMIRQRFAGLKGPKKERPRPVYNVPDHPSTLFSIATDPEASDTSVAVYTKIPKRPEDTVGDYRRSLTEGLYHSMLNARLAEIARGADPPFLWAGSQSGVYVRTSEVAYQAVGVRDGEIPRGLAALLTETERVQRHGFTATELDRVKKDLLVYYEQAYRELDKLESSNFSSEYIRNFTQQEPVPGIPMERELVNALLPTITLADVNRLASEWNRDANRVILVNAPDKPGVPVPTEKELLAIFQKAAASPVQAYVDRTVDGPLLPVAPKAGAVVQEKKIEELGITEWRLSNGVKVVLKPTDYQNDQILLLGFGPGGHSVVSDEDFPSALFASTLVEEGGVGTFDPISLEKALAGKLASASTFISQLEQGIQGGAAPRDVETLFQLVSLRLTAPRRDETAFQSFLTRMQAFIANRLAQPDEVFQDEMTKALTGNHPRWQPLTPDFVKKIDLAKAEKVYRDRFADFSGFTFILVGNFTPESIKPLVQTYIASLPATGRKETWRDVGVRLPTGVVKVNVNKGLEPKAQVQIVFTGESAFDRENRHMLGALATLLEIRLREILREDLSAVYGVEVSSDFAQRPRQQYNLAISFTCDPAKADELVQATFGEIESIQKNGVPENYVQQIRETERRNRQLALKENQFWLQILEVYYSEGFDPKDILRYDELVERVTAERMQAAARTYLPKDRYVLGVLRPEKTAAAAAAPAAPASGQP